MGLLLMLSIIGIIIILENHANDVSLYGIGKLIGAMSLIAIVILFISNKKG